MKWRAMASPVRGGMPGCMASPPLFREELGFGSREVEVPADHWRERGRQDIGRKRKI